ncbi:hypothetical protein F511_14863 [Dorcoceras hygrometricum]|uniref:Uncharacterized protein n=1 Tax=Dorcoceras hygrometricum TaxID=472368 RepID=A0A2Z7CJK5_9LAMI|nr:hypothetical protein F511_14863 [Dorcoceras hygrometricum]
MDAVSYPCQKRRNRFSLLKRRSSLIARGSSLKGSSLRGDRIRIRLVLLVLVVVALEECRVGVATDPDPAPESGTLLASRRLAPTSFTGKLALQRLAAVVLRIRSTTGITAPSSVCTRRPDEFITNGISSSRRSEQVHPRRRRHTTAARRRVEEAAAEEENWGREAATS